LLVAGSVGLHLLESFHGLDWLRDSFPPLYALAINPTFKAGIVIVGAIFAFLAFIELRHQRHARQEPASIGVPTITTSGQSGDVIIGNKTEEHHHGPISVGNTSDQLTLSHLRTSLPESTIGQLRGHQQFPASIKQLLLTFLKETEGPDQAFLDEELEELRRRLRHKVERLVELLSNGPPNPIRYSLVSRMACGRYYNDLSWRSQAVCSTYDDLIIAARRRLETVSGGLQQHPNVSLDASGANRAVQGTKVGRDLFQGDRIGGDQVYGNKIVHSHAGSAPPPEPQPAITVRILDVAPVLREVRIDPFSRRNGTVTAEIRHAVTVIFSALLTNNFQTSLDDCVIHVSLPSGSAVACQDITHSEVLSEKHQPTPSGVPPFSPPEALTQNVTLKRFVRWWTIEHVTLDEPASGFPNNRPDVLRDAALSKRKAAGAYNDNGNLCLMVRDSLGTRWNAERNWKS